METAKYFYSPGSSWNKAGISDSPLIRRIQELCEYGSEAYARSDIKGAKSFFEEALVNNSRVLSLTKIFLEDAVKEYEAGNNNNAKKLVELWKIESEREGYFTGLARVIAYCHLRLGNTSEAVKFIDRGSFNDQIDPILMGTLREYLLKTDKKYSARQHLRG